MELRQLRYAVAVADHRSFHAAAAALYVAQPAVSQQVAHLERELGLRLFDRGPRTGVELTPAGQYVIEAARRALLAAGELATLAHELEGLGVHLVRVGTTAGLGPRLQAILALLGERDPRLAVRLETGATADKLGRVRSGTLDAAFVREPGELTGLGGAELWQDRLVAVLPAGCAAAQASRVHLADLASMRVLLPDRRASPGAYARVAALFAAAGATPRPAPFRGGLQETLALVGSTGDIAALVYETTGGWISRLRPAGVAVRPLADRGATLGCVLVTGENPTPATEAFVTAATDVAAHPPRRRGASRPS